MNSLHQIGIAGQRGDRRDGVALHQARHMRLQGGEAPSDACSHTIHAAFEILPEPFDGVQLRADVSTLFRTQNLIGF